ncbi:MAG TPA: hypothetical protein VNE39_15455 [Planctomycetota bacterium]|nr:hypothetical protein [Planctomycetota bacterium]
MSIAVCALLVAGASGCTYLRNRGADASQMMDLGLTFSKKPQFGLYANCPMVTPLGYSKVDGYFVGMGGGKLGAGEHHQNNSGLLFWGHEENSWKGFNDKDKATTESHRVGVIGIAQSAKEGKTKYRPACVHYLHLGYVGVMWNLNYFKMADFFCGWFGWIPFGERSEVTETRVAKAGNTTKVAKAPTAPKPAAVTATPPAPAPAAAPKPPVVASAPPARAAKADRGERRSSPFEFGPPAEVPSASKPATLASAEPTPPLAPPAPPAPATASAPAPKPAKAERLAEAPLPPLPPDEIALAVARDVAAAKAELAALRQAQSAAKPPKLVAEAADEAPAAPPKSRFPIEQLVP